VTVAEADDAPDAASPPDPTDDAGAAADAATSACAAPPSASTCGDSAWVRGIAHFDPSHFAPGAAPILRVVLRHEFIEVAGEEKIGGRLHMYTSIPVTDIASGKQEFAIDMCGLGTAMWSEENSTFHLVLIFDENGDNNLDDATSNEDAITIGTPTTGELTSMTDVDISCNAPSACLDITSTCTTGASCLTFEPIKSCTKKTPACKSDSVFCN
jgi:hypothetical protein